jgi:hypothetical protein
MIDTEKKTITGTVNSEIAESKLYEKWLVGGRKDFIVVGNILTYYKCPHCDIPLLLEATGDEMFKRFVESVFKMEMHNTSIIPITGARFATSFRYSPVRMLETKKLMKDESGQIRLYAKHHHEMRIRIFPFVDLRYSAFLILNVVLSSYLKLQKRDSPDFDHWLLKSIGIVNDTDKFMKNFPGAFELIHPIIGIGDPMILRDDKKTEIAPDFQALIKKLDKMVNDGTIQVVDV